MPRSFGSVPYAPTDRYDYSGSRITDLILRQGDIAAQRAAESGRIWGGTVADLGQIAGQAIEKHQERKAASEREAAWSEYLDSGSWADDPLDAYKTATRVWGRDEGPKMFEGLMAVQQLTKGKVKTPEQAQEYLGLVADKAASMSDETLTKYWPVLRGAVLGFNQVTGAQLDLGEQYDPALRPQIGEYAKAFRQAQAKKTREIKTRGPRGQEIIKIVEDVPDQEFISEPEPEKPIVVEGSVIQQQPGGGVEVLYTAPEKPASPGAHSWVMRNGQPVRVAESEIQPGDLPYESPKTGQTRIPAGVTQEIADMQTGLTQSGELRKKLAGGTASMLSRAGAAMDVVLPGITKLTGWGQDAKNQGAVIALVKQIIGKSLEGGVLRKEDEVKYAHMIPVLGDSDETVKTKLDTMDNAIKNKRDNQLQALADAGYNTSAFEARLAKEPQEPSAAGGGGGGAAPGEGIDIDYYDLFPEERPQ